MVLTVYITFWRGQAIVCSLVAKPANSVYVISIIVSKKHHNTAFLFSNPMWRHWVSSQKNSLTCSQKTSPCISQDTNEKPQGVLPLTHTQNKKVETKASTENQPTATCIIKNPPDDKCHPWGEGSPRERKLRSTKCQAGIGISHPRSNRMKQH